MIKAKEKKSSVGLTIGLCFVIIFCGLGAWAQRAVFTRPITIALGIDRTIFSISNTIRYVVTAIVNVFFGYLVGRFGVRKLVISSFILMTLAPLCYALANSIWLIYLGGALLGVGLSFASTAIIGYIVNKICKKNKGTIMGLVLCANGLTGAILVNVYTPLITAGTFGYRNAFFVMALLAFVAFLLLLIFFKEPQENFTQEDLTTKQEKKENWIGIDYSVAKKKAFFYLACVCVLFTGLTLTAVSSNARPHMEDRGVAMSVLTIIATFSSLFLALFKFLSGFLYDRLGLRVTITIQCAAMLIAIIICVIITPELGWLGIIYSILHGVAMPLETVMIPIYAKDLFGQKSFAKVLGIFVSLNQIGYAFGDPIMNIFYTVFGSYDIGLIVMFIVTVALIIALQFVISASNKLKKIDQL